MLFVFVTGFPINDLLTACACSEPMSVDHALTCPSGGYPIARHDEVKNVLPDAMRDAVAKVEVEPSLLPYDDENLPGKSANRATEAHLDSRAMGFWTHQQNAFFMCG